MSQPSRIPAALSLDGLGSDARAAFDLAARAGYQGVAIPTNHPQLRPAELGASAIRHVKKVLADRQLRAESVRVAAPRAGLTDGATIDRTIEQGRAAIRLAYDLGAGTVAMHTGPLEGMKVSAETLRQAVAVLAGEADKAGVTLAFSAEGSAKLEELLKQVGFERARANLQSAALVGGGEDPMAAAERLAGRIAQWTCGDAIRAGSQVRAVEMGEGQVPWRELAAFLRDQDFRGPTVVDVRELANTPGAAARAAEVLRTLLVRES